MDLAGVGVDLSEAAFAHWIEDESLQRLHIHRGDIAIIDPMAVNLRVGNLILLELDGRPAFRRLSKKGRLWFIRAAGHIRSEAVPLGTHPIYGAVIGITRLFTEVKAVKYRGTESNFKPSFERKGSQGGTPSGNNHKPATLYSPSRPKKKTKLFPLIPGEPSLFSLSEMEERSR